MYVSDVMVLLMLLLLLLLVMVLVMVMVMVVVVVVVVVVVIMVAMACVLFEAQKLVFTETQIYKAIRKQPILIPSSLPSLQCLSPVSPSLYWLLVLIAHSYS